MDKDSRIYIAGHKGMVGSAIHRQLAARGFNNFILRTLEELDLTNQADVADFFETERPEYVILAAAKVGGIHANNIYRAQFIYENLQIQNNVIHHSYLNGVKKLLFLGSSCIYPKNAAQPLKEEYLLTGDLEQTNEPYAIAKIAGIKMCESYARQYGSNFVSVMPTNLFGPNDNYNLETSHVLPALVRKIHLARQLETGNWKEVRRDLDRRPIENVTGKAEELVILDILSKYGITVTPGSNPPEVEILLWGTGRVFREFMHVDDMAAACILALERLNARDLLEQPEQVISTFINIGTGRDQTIAELAELIKKITEFTGNLRFDHTRPDGTYRKLLDISKLEALGFRPRYSLEEGIRHVYSNYIE